MKWIFCLAFILGNSFGIFAQATDVTETKFLTALDKANLNWSLYRSPYRTVQTGEITLNSKKENFDRQLNSYKIVLEIDKKIGIHAVYEFSKNSAKGKYESVEIVGKYGKYFERNDDGSWLEVEKLSKKFGLSTLPSSGELKRIQESSETNHTTVDYEYLGNEEINNQTTDVYMITIKRTENSGKNLRTLSRKFWFANDGKILKSAEEVIVESEGGFSRSQYTQTWEADENIKIEAPKMSGAQ